MKNLPLTSQTEISGYQFYIFPYTILYTFPEYKDYLTEHYMQCFGYIVDDLNHMTFGYSDGVSYNDMSYSPGPLDITYNSYTVGLQLDVKKYIISSIDNNNYVVIFVDEYYMENRPAYQKYHRLHDILIFGYDDEKFNCFTFDRRPSFSSFSQNQIDDAYKSGHSEFLKLSEDLSQWIEEKSIISVKLRNVRQQYNFSSERFVKKLKLYVDGKFDDSYSSFVMPEEKCYIGVYNTKLIKYHIDNPSENVYILYPAIHAWYESKRNLLNKIKYCREKNNFTNNELISDYESKVERQCEKIRLSFLKYQRSGTLNNEAVSILLNSIFTHEFNIINCIHDELIKWCPFSDNSL